MSTSREMHLMHALQGMVDAYWEQGSHSVDQPAAIMAALQAGAKEPPAVRVRAALDRIIYALANQENPVWAEVKSHNTILLKLEDRDYELRLMVCE